MKINRQQLRRLIESTMRNRNTLNEAVTSAERAFLERVRQTVKRHLGPVEGTYLTIGTNESGMPGVLISISMRGLVSDITPILEREFPGKTVEYFPRVDQPNRAKEYNLTVPGDIVVELKSGNEVQGQTAAELGGDRGIFVFGPTHFVEM